MTIDYPMSSLKKHITVHVRLTGERVFWFRWWCATKLIILAALVSGVGIKVEVATK